MKILEIEDFKMKVTHQENVKLQNFLFNNGYYWHFYKIIKNSDAPCFYLIDGFIHTSEINIFHFQAQKEITYNEFFKKYDLKNQRKNKLKQLNNFFIK